MNLPDPDLKNLTTLGIAVTLSILGSTLLLNRCNTWSKEQDAIHARNDSLINPHKYGISYYQKEGYKPDGDKPKKHQYLVIILDDPSEGSTYEIEQTNIDNRVKAKKVPSKYDYLNGIWEFECDEYLPTPEAQYEYIKAHHKELKRIQNK